MIAHPLAMELALLGYLRHEPLHGYQIHQRLLEPDGLGQVWRLKQAQLYALLEKLEATGLIVGAIQVQEARPARRVYRLTSEGQETFATWLKTPVSTPRQMRQEFQAKLYFAQLEGKRACAQLIAAQQQACRNWIESHQVLAEHHCASNTYTWLVDQYRVGQIQAMLNWLDACLGTL